MGSGLYESLVNLGLLIPHEEVGHSAAPIPELHYRTLKPQRVPFISYPYEWSFSQFKDAGLLTLEIQKQALSNPSLLIHSLLSGMRKGRPGSHTVNFASIFWPPWR
jgi:hypothetical protein